jgi:hypothetical protein
MGAITGVIGSLVAAYFGVQLGASGKAASDAQATQQSAVAAQQSTIANAALAKLPPTESQDAIDNAQRLYEATSQQSA